MSSRGWMYLFPYAMQAKISSVFRYDQKSVIDTELSNFKWRKIWFNFISSSWFNSRCGKASLWRIYQVFMRSWPSIIYGYAIWIVKRKGHRELLALSMNYLKSARLQNISHSTIKKKMPAEQSTFTESEPGYWNGIGTSLLWMILIGRRSFTSGHRWEGIEEEKHNNHGEPSGGLYKQKLGIR